MLTLLSQRLKSWYNNHDRQSKKTIAPKRADTIILKKKRALQGFQIYYNMHYKDKIKPRVDVEYPLYIMETKKKIAEQAERLALSAEQGMTEQGREDQPEEAPIVLMGRFAFSNDLARVMLAAESDEVKAEVERRKASGKEDVIPEDIRIARENGLITEDDAMRYIQNQKYQE